MTAVAVIGLGIMGGPMAANLGKAGYEVIGVRRSDSVGRAVSRADVILTVLPDSPDVEAVASGDDGIIANAKPGSVWIDSSTIRPDVSVRLAQAAAGKGIRAVDAPVSGGEAGAVDATLSVMVGGSAEDFEAAKPVLDVVGSTVVHVGPPGAGQTVKAANQLIVAGTIELVAESIVFLEAHGVDTDAAVRVLAGGLAGNRILDRKAEGMLAREFQPGFRVDLHHKDLGIVTSAARGAGVAIPLGAAVAQLMGALRQQGHGSLDHSALVLLVEQLSGRAR
ncbi:NAD(P)-dependent oxidoreductase [Kibdelosporangium phytohabitans]|uniref:2-hydroxy-3-oxopropionate reductase n=1 Tax=Kibdelosporangium phytohabitans TaxID=860235 RepID=A0A0N9IF30_9PSEU|nr:NAD(P)-binding domain-containing protein [Kibdelosporangium phytohabitans]ALG13392.1 2-hydroxy-3-oxopropionate reductase [Kibdelosporangium phytohabitans]MBE1465188.1 2-hydroxy-3-oxopropionate reductase [Kibdelosporangium phytohabitans]